MIAVVQKHTAKSVREIGEIFSDGLTEETIMRLGRPAPIRS
jgi:TolB-like protein